MESPTIGAEQETRSQDPQCADYNPEGKKNRQVCESVSYVPYVPGYILTRKKQKVWLRGLGIWDWIVCLFFCFFLHNNSGTPSLSGIIMMSLSRGEICRLEMGLFGLSGRNYNVMSGADRYWVVTRRGWAGGS